jgi:hypothetical protein
MRFKYFNIHQTAVFEKVLPLLKGTIFHCTTTDGLKGIMNDGFIKPNIKGDFKSLLPNYNSFGFKKGYIHLFDFRNTDDNIISQTYACYDFFKHDKENKCTNIIINYDKIKSSLIPNSMSDGWCIPKTECWCAVPIPTKYIKMVVVTNITGFSSAYKIANGIK